MNQNPCIPDPPCERHDPGERHAALADLNATAVELAELRERRQEAMDRAKDRIRRAAQLGIRPTEIVERCRPGLSRMTVYGMFKR